MKNITYTLLVAIITLACQTSLFAQDRTKTEDSKIKTTTKTVTKEIEKGADKAVEVIEEEAIEVKRAVFKQAKKTDKAIKEEAVKAEKGINKAADKTVEGVKTGTRVVKEGTLKAVDKVDEFVTKELNKTEAKEKARTQKDLKTTVSNGDQKASEAKEKIASAKRQLEKERAAGSVSDTDYKSRLGKIANAEKAVENLEQKVSKAKKMN